MYEIGRVHAIVTQHKSNSVNSDTPSPATEGGLVKSQAHSSLNTSGQLEGANDVYAQTSKYKNIYYATTYMNYWVSRSKLTF